MLKRLVERKSKDQDQVKGVAKLLGQAMKLAERRNVIVHNPWTIRVDIDARVRSYKASPRYHRLAAYRPRVPMRVLAGGHFFLLDDRSASFCGGCGRASVVRACRLLCVAAIRNLYACSVYAIRLS